MTSLYRSLANIFRSRRQQKSSALSNQTDFHLFRLYRPTSPFKTFRPNMVFMLHFFVELIFFVEIIPYDGSPEPEGPMSLTVSRRLAARATWFESTKRGKFSSPYELMQQFAADIVTTLSHVKCAKTLIKVEFEPRWRFTNFYSIPRRLRPP